MYITLTNETSPTIQSNEILIVMYTLASSGLVRFPQDKYIRHLADLQTAKTIIRDDLTEEWQFDSSTATKILLLFNGSSKEFVGNPADILELKLILRQ